MYKLNYMNSLEIRDLFLLNPEITFLNFGSFGACPKPILKRYQEFQLEFEEDPVHFYKMKGMDYLDVSKEALASFVHCKTEDIVFVTNPSYAVNAIARSFLLEKGDEILTTSLEYGACDKTWQYYCEKAGAIYRQQEIKFPLASKEDFLEQFWKGLSAKTKLIFISHITSSTGIKLPVEEICLKANELGIPVFIDGAHAPGQVDLDLEKLNPTYYTGACHKWMMTPRGCSFMYVKKEAQKSIDPLIISWGYKSIFPSNSQLQDYHQVNGTRDFTPFLTIPIALEFRKNNLWDKVSEDCRTLVKTNALKLCECTGTESIVPISDEFLVQMYAAEIKTTQPEGIQKRLYEEFQIQIPIIRLEKKSYIRYSINGFNSQSDLDRLFEVMPLIMSEK